MNITKLCATAAMLMASIGLTQAAAPDGPAKLKEEPVTVCSLKVIDYTTQEQSIAALFSPSDIEEYTIKAASHNMIQQVQGGNLWFEVSCGGK